MTATVSTYRSSLDASASPFAGSPISAKRWHPGRSEEHTSELQSHLNLVCRLLLEKTKPPINAFYAGQLSAFMTAPAIMTSVVISFFATCIIVEAIVASVCADTTAGIHYAERNNS